MVKQGKRKMRQWERPWDSAIAGLGKREEFNKRSAKVTEGFGEKGYKDSSKIREVGTLYPELVFCLWAVTNPP